MEARLRHSSKTITYNLLETNNGWQLRVLLPRSLPVDDQIIILDWIHNYRKQVQNANPRWLTTFRLGDATYWLDIIRTETPRQLIEQSLGGQLWQQLEFDYAR